MYPTHGICPDCRAPVYNGICECGPDWPYDDALEPPPTDPPTEAELEAGARAWYALLGVDYPAGVVA